MKLTVLYPFIEEAFCEQTTSFIEELVWIKKAQATDLLITVDKEGKTTEALKKAKLPFERLPFTSPVHARDFYFTALFKLIRSSLAAFFYFKTHHIDVTHCPDISSLLCFGNVSKMNRVPFVTSVQKDEKYSHYASLMLTDSRKLICSDENIRNNLLKRFPSALLAPRVQNIEEKQNKADLRKETVDFWIKLYVSLFIKSDLSKITSILNKD